MDGWTEDGDDLAQLLRNTGGAPPSQKKKKKKKRGDYSNIEVDTFTMEVH